MNRNPKAGSSAWMAGAALIRCASSQSRCVRGALRHLQNPWAENPSTRQVTVTGTPSRGKVEDQRVRHLS